MTKVVNLFAAPPGSCAFEVHEHCFVTGPRARSAVSKFSHSHEGGSERHRHVDTGPSCYTIDKDEWRATTGMQGGRRKKFTKSPSGEQLPLRDLEEWQESFEVVVCEQSALPGSDAQGGGMAAATRMVLAFRMDAKVRRP